VLSLSLSFYPFNTVAQKLRVHNAGNPNLLDKKKETPLHVAIRNVKRQSTLTAILIVLLHYGADPDLPDANGITVRGLLADSPTLLALVETRGGRNLLPYMAAHPSSSTTSAENNEASFIVNTVRNTLLQPDRCDEMMMQTIMSAVHEDDRSAAILWLLMENGAAFHCTSDMSAILYNAIQILACYEGGRPDKCMAQLCILLEKGVNPNLIVSTETHETALHVAIRQSRCRDIMGAAVLMLLMRGANPNAQDIEGKTPMHYAVRVDNVQFGTFLVLLLIDKGGDPNIVDARGRTPLHSALYKSKGIVSSLNMNTTQHKQTKYNINLCYFAYLEQMLVCVAFD